MRCHPHPQTAASRHAVGASGGSCFGQMKGKRALGADLAAEIGQHTVEARTDQQIDQEEEDRR